MKDLRLIAKIIEKETGRKAEVKEVYIDYGANWKAENIIIDDEYQLLSPRAIEEGITLEELQKLIDKINKRSW